MSHIQSDVTGPEESRKRERTVWVLAFVDERQIKHLLTGIWTIDPTQAKEVADGVAFA